MRTLLIAIMVLCAAGQAFALTPLGPPVATVEKGKFAVGYGWCGSNVDMEVSAFGITTCIEDQGITTHLMNLGFGLDDNWELQIDLGLSDTNFEGGSSETDFTGGFVLRSTFAKTDDIKWGAVSSLHWYGLQGSGVSGDIDWNERQSWTELQFAIGPSWKPGRWCLYGGPFLHFINGEFEGTYGGFDVSGDFEQDSMFGGFVGARIDLTKHAELGIEYQRTGSANAVGVSILWRF